MYPVLKIMHMLNFLDMFSVGVTKTLALSVTKTLALGVRFTLIISYIFNNKNFMTLLTF